MTEGVAEPVAPDPPQPDGKPQDGRVLRRLVARLRPRAMTEDQLEILSRIKFPCC